MMSPLFDRLGREAAIEAAVVLFYEKVMADPELARFFDGLDMQAQIKKQIAFMTMAFGGPSRYTGRELRTAHAPLVARGLNESHFDAIAGLLKDTLVELEIEPSAIDEVLEIVTTTKKDVLNQ